jgi:hypothetical protein
MTLCVVGETDRAADLVRSRSFELTRWTYQKPINRSMHEPQVHAEEGEYHSIGP